MLSEEVNIFCCRIDLASWKHGIFLPFQKMINSRLEITDTTFF